MASNCFPINLSPNLLWIKRPLNDSFRINLKSFRKFRGHLFYKSITGRELSFWKHDILK